jgi:thymidylate synthase (FAD)
VETVRIKVDFKPELSEAKILKKLERAGRICYKSEDRITPTSAQAFYKGLLKRNHMAIAEHVSLTVFVTTDRGVSHEIVRHRIASYAQESTRYVNHKGGAKFIDPRPHFTNPKSISVWAEAMFAAEGYYQQLIALGETPQMARAVLPNSTKTEIVITMNLREWIHFFSLRYLGSTGKPHPQMKETAGLILKKFMRYYPNIFKVELE